jgi:DME family drug/metabolite transporter
MPRSYQPAGKRRGILLISCSAILWGTVGVVTQAIFRRTSLDATAVGFYRLAIAFPFLALLSWATGGKGAFVIRRRALIRLVLIGFLLASYQVLYFASIRRAGVAVATLVTLCTAPVIVAGLSSVFLKETFTRQNFWALTLAVSGTACLIGAPQAVNSRADLLIGILLGLGSAFGYALVTLLGRSVAGRNHPLPATTISFVSGAVFLLPFSQALSSSTPFTSMPWGLLLYIGLVPTAIGYTLFFHGMRHLKATAASTLTLLEPLTATLLAWWLFGERLGPLGIVGAILLPGSLLLLACESGPQA